MPPLQADHSALERSRRPRGRRHLRTHVRVRAGIRAADRAYQRACILIRPCAVSEKQRALVARLPARVAADRRAVRVGKAVWRVRAAGCKRRPVRARLRPAVVAADAVGLMRRLAGLQVGQRGQHGRDAAGGHVDRRAGRRVDVVPSIMWVRGLVGGQGQTLVHL